MQISSKKVLKKVFYCEFSEYEDCDEIESEEMNPQDSDEESTKYCPKDPNKTQTGEVQTFLQKKNLAQVRKAF